MNAIVENDSTIVTRHPIYLFYMAVKWLLIWTVWIVLGVIFTIYKSEVPADLIHYFIFPAVLILVNYAMFQLVFWIIRYHNKLIIVVRDRIILISSSLILKEDIEIMELSKVMKIDVECHGLLPNVLNFGMLIIEQQKNDVRTMRLVPDPFTVLRIIREKTNYLSASTNAWTGDLAFFKV